MENKEKFKKPPELENEKTCKTKERWNTLVKTKRKKDKKRGGKYEHNPSYNKLKTERGEVKENSKMRKKWLRLKKDAKKRWS